MMISNNLKSYSCFIPVKRGFLDGKKPDSPKGVDWNNNLLTYEQANEYVNKGGNIGLVLGHGLFGIDVDNKQLLQMLKNIFPQSYEEDTPSNGKHFVYKFDGEVANKNLILNKIHYGELRAQRQYIVIAPSEAKSKISGKVTPYVIVNDVEPAKITSEQIEKFLKLFDEEKLCCEKESPKTTVRGVTSELTSEPKELVDRSKYDFARCCQMIESGCDFEDVCRNMETCGSPKWHGRNEKYRRDTFEGAYRRVKSGNRN